MTAAPTTCPAHSGMIQVQREHERRLDDHESRIRVNEVFRVRGALLVTLLGTILSGLVSTALTLWLSGGGVP